MAGTTFSSANWTGYDDHTADISPGANLTSFTLLIDVSGLSATWMSEVQSDGADIRITKEDGTTELAYDLIDWAYNAGAPTGFIRVLWSSTLATATSTQKVRIWAGYTGGTAIAYDATETFGSDNAYDSNWAAYFPLTDLNDRTANGRDLTGVNGPTSGATGKVGDGYDFESGSSQYAYSTGSDISTHDLTLMLWFSRESSCYPIGIGDASVPGMARLRALSSLTQVAIQDVSGGSEDGGGSPGTGTLVHMAGVITSSTLEMFLNGSTDGSTSHSRGATNCDTIVVGGTVNAGTFTGADGICDDAQFHTTPRSADWITHEYDQTNDNATFWGTWAWTAVGGGGSSRRSPAIFDARRRQLRRLAY